MQPMHGYTEDTEELARRSSPTRGAGSRTRSRSTARSRPRSSRAGPAQTVTAEGIGGEEALRVWAEVLAPATISTDHPASLAFVPGRADEGGRALRPGRRAPPRRSRRGGSTAPGPSGRRTRRCGGSPTSPGFPRGRRRRVRLGRLRGQPLGAGHGARTPPARSGTADRRGGGSPSPRACIRRVVTAARVMDVGVLDVPRRRARTADGRGARARRSTARPGGDGLFAVVASAGATNAGTVDDLAGVAEVCAERGLWFHVDGAYGGAGLAGSVGPRPLSTASSAPTRSSSIRTSGCSRPTTAARCCTAIPSVARTRSGRRPATSTP